MVQWCRALSEQETGIDYLTDPWTFEFMQRGLAAALVVSVLCAVLGTFVVLKGLAFIGDAMAHSAFAGVAMAFLLKGNIYLGAVLWSLFSGLAIAFLGRRPRVSFDTAIGIIFAGSFALGIVLISRARNYTVDLFSFLFGNILGVGNGDLIIMAALGAFVLATVIVFYKEFLFVSYDPTMASALGVPVGVVQYGLIALLGLTTVVSIKAVGLILVVALLVTPAATAALFTRRLGAMMLLGSLFAVLSSVIGLYLSFYIDVASGATIVLVATGFFLLGLLFSPRAGILTQRRPRFVLPTSSRREQ